MERYVFKLQGGDETIFAEHSAALADLRAVWSEVASLAHRIDMTGGRIIVTSQSGDMLILVGAATARAYPLAANTKKNELASASHRR
jgi:hypothetical protein